MRSLTGYVESRSNNFMASLLDNNSNVFNQQITSRLFAVVSTPVYIILPAIDIIIGIGNQIGNILQFGRNKEQNSYLAESYKILTKSLFEPLKIFYPKATYDDIEVHFTSGIFTNNVEVKFDWLVLKTMEGDSFVAKQVGRRLIYLTKIVCLVAARALDFIIGAVSFVAMACTLGCFDKINTFTLRHLKIFAVVEDIFHNLVYLVNTENVFEQKNIDDKFPLLKDPYSSEGRASIAYNGLISGRPIRSVDYIAEKFGVNSEKLEDLVAKRFAPSYKTWY